MEVDKSDRDDVPVALERKIENTDLHSTQRAIAAAGALGCAVNRETLLLRLSHTDLEHRPGDLRPLAVNRVVTGGADEPPVNRNPKVHGGLETLSEVRQEAINDEMINGGDVVEHEGIGARWIDVLQSLDMHFNPK
jgi:hypothetical protein